jgi:hypothetical protein
VRGTTLQPLQGRDGHGKHLRPTYGGGFEEQFSAHGVVAAPPAQQEPARGVAVEQEELADVGDPIGAGHVHAVVVRAKEHTERARRRRRRRPRPARPWPGSSSVCTLAARGASEAKWCERASKACAASS